eukprot:11167244-Lingulodinium_polyedra.AAC.1
MATSGGPRLGPLARLPGRPRPRAAELRLATAPRFHTPRPPTDSTPMRCPLHGHAYASAPG